ncbi:MAG TPA: hypothetical protein VHW01_18070, partial [Polyangiaceae bacterium]|nr:hypothetical protein [Polyangiaceae bacterium]
MKQRTSFIRRSLALCSLALLGTSLLPACSTKKGADRGGLMLEILTDGSAIDRVDVDIESGQKDLLQNSYKVPSEARLPTTIAIVSSGNAAQTVNISIVGWQDGIPFDRRDSIVTQIPADRVAALRVVLSARCAGHVSLQDDKVVSDCAVGTTCDPSSADASCTNSRVPASNLGGYTPGDENRDAGPASAGGDSGATSTGGGGGDGGSENANGGSENGGAQANGGSESGGTSAGSGGEATGPACKKDADCNALLPVTTPKGCAVAACAGQKCVFTSVDGD